MKAYTRMDESTRAYLDEDRDFYSVELDLDPYVVGVADAIEVASKGIDAVLRNLTRRAGGFDNVAVNEQLEAYIENLVRSIETQKRYRRNRRKDNDD